MAAAPIRARRPVVSANKALARCTNSSGEENNSPAASSSPSRGASKARFAGMSRAKMQAWRSMASKSALDMPSLIDVFTTMSASHMAAARAPCGTAGRIWNEADWRAAKASARAASRTGPMTTRRTGLAPSRACHAATASIKNPGSFTGRIPAGSKIKVAS